MLLKLLLGHQTVTKAREAALRMINVIFPVKYCSSSPMLRALLMSVGRMKVLGAVLSLAPGAGGHRSGCGLTLSQARLWWHRSGKSQRDVEAQSPPSPLDVSIPSFSIIPYTCPQQAQPSEPSWEVNTAQCENEQ